VFEVLKLAICFSPWFGVLIAQGWIKSTAELTLFLMGIFRGVLKDSIY
jgi:hypothetical protein